MTSGFGFADILVSEITVIIGAVIFLFCCVLLIVKRKSLSGLQKGLSIAVLVLATVYLALIILFAILWGQQPPLPTPQPMP